MKMGEYRLGFIGFGHMAQALFEAIDRAKIFPRSHITFIRRDPMKMKANQEKFGITSSSLETLVRTSQCLILAVRPAQASQIVEAMAQLGVQDKMIMTVIAGLPISFYQKILGAKAQILRAMPNIASSIGEGMSLFAFSSTASQEMRSLAQRLFSNMGSVAEIEEAWMDISTGISGSGPGFVFRLIAAMARAGEEEGLPYDIALKMSAQTFAGAARLILNGASPKDLIHQIASPHGTTEAGFKVMSELQVDQHFQTVILAAAQRSKELSKSTETKSK